MSQGKSSNWVSLSAGANSALASSFGYAAVTNAVRAEGASETNRYIFRKITLAEI